MILKVVQPDPLQIILTNEFKRSDLKERFVHKLNIAHSAGAAKLGPMLRFQQIAY